MRVLVIGGMHGNEPLGVNVVKRLQENPIENVDAMIANPEALAADVRFISQDLNRSFPGAKDGIYEEKRAAEIMKACQQYDVVLDFHNTFCPDNDCGFIGETASEKLLDVASMLGFSRIIIADYDCINKYAPNCLSVEISMTSECNNVDEWIKRIKRLAATPTPVAIGPVETYRFVYRMTLEDRERLDLANAELRAFRPMLPEISQAMGLQGTTYPIFIGDRFTPYNYGGVLKKLN